MFKPFGAVNHSPTVRFPSTPGNTLGMYTLGTFFGLILVVAGGRSAVGEMVLTGIGWSKLR